MTVPGVTRNQMPPPVTIEAGDDQPEEPVPGAQARAAVGSEGDLELLAQQEILEKEVVMAAEGSKKGAEQEPEEGEHHIRIAGLASEDGPDEILPPYDGLAAVHPGCTGNLGLCAGTFIRQVDCWARRTRAGALRRDLAVS